MRPRTCLPLFAAASVMVLNAAGCTKEPAEAGSTAGEGTLTSSAEARDAVRRQSNRFNAAWATENLDVMMPLLADDAILASPDAPDSRGQVAIRERLTKAFGRYQVEVYQAHIDTIEVFDDVAYEWGTFDERFSEAGKPPVQLQGRYVYRWAKGGDGIWRISRITGNDIKRETGVTAK